MFEIRYEMFASILVGLEYQVKMEKSGNGSQNFKCKISNFNIFNHQVYGVGSSMHPNRNQSMTNYIDKIARKVQNSNFDTQKYAVKFASLKSKLMQNQFFTI